MEERGRWKEVWGRRRKEEGERGRDNMKREEEGGKRKGKEEGGRLRGKEEGKRGRGR